MGLIENFINYRDRIIKDESRRRATAEVDEKIARHRQAMLDEEENLRKMINNELSKEELKELYQRLQERLK